MHKLKILILEDMEDEVGLMLRSIEKDGILFESKQVDNKQDFIAALRTYRPDVILADHSLPQFNSMDALRFCRLAKLSAPFILVTGTVSEEFAVACLKQGADDYVIKSNLARLPSAIKNALKQHELQSRRLKAELELRIQNEELVKINQEMDSFIYSVSHNLRAPLMSVLGLINLTKAEDLTMERVHEYLNMINVSVLKLDETLKDIIDYSKNSRYEILCEKVDLKRLIDISFEHLGYLNGFSQVEKTVTIEEQTPLYSDVYRLRIILNNIIANSIKYRDTEKESNFLKIKATISPERTSLSFSDNGIGIGEENINKVFNMFYRGTLKSDGAGLGLYIVKETVTKLKGSINVSSERGKGTEITIELPYHQPHESTKQNTVFENTSI